LSPTPAIHTLSLHDALPISDQVIVFGGDECSGQRANFVVAPADAGHVEQAVVFSGVAQDRRNALGLEEVVAIAVELLPCRTGKGDRKSTRLNSSHGSISYAV